MFKGILNWFKNIIKKRDNKISTQAIVQIIKPKPIGVTTKVYLNDPTYPSLIVDQHQPPDTMLAMRAIGDEGPGYPLGSIQQQASATRLMVNDILVYMISKSPKKIKGWAVVQSLMLMSRAGKDVNAYYDRGSLRFFYFGDPIAKNNVFACNARPVVTHEFGHAFLDILRPEWWDAQSMEIWAFHEAFGDMTAVLAALQYNELIEYAVAETDGNLMKSNILSRLAAEMGIALYHLTNGKDGEMKDCLRDLTKIFKYVEPETLPAEGRDDILINEAHSFSRVFAGAFWEILVKIGNEQGTNLKEGIKISRDIMAHYLLTAVTTVPSTIRLFDAVAQQILNIDHAEGGKYQKIIQEVFTNRGIIRQQMMMLNDVDITTFLKNIKDPHEIQIHGNKSIVRTLTTKTIKLSENLGPLVAQDNNPLLNLEIIVPNQTVYYFDENDKLTGIIQPHENEIVNAAYNCLKILNEKGFVGNHDKALFEEKNGKLIRKQIACVCGRPNYCDPNAPEYGKPWKPANNSGCVACHNKHCKPQSCECNLREEFPAPKTGCFTRLKVGGRTTYKVGSCASRKVC